LQAFHAHEATHNGLETELLQNAEDFCSHRFAFLNLPSVNLDNPVDWGFAPESDRLWQYNLHYGEWAITLAQAYLISNDTRFKNSLIDLLNDWIDHNPVGKGAGWEPYPISRRLVTWSRVGLALAQDPSWQDFVKMRLVPSLRQQGKVLASNLEHDLANNHLVANYKAMAWIGLLFPNWPEAEKWKSIGLTGLWAEMRRQVLPDGVHDERSISYHTIVLQDLLEVWWLAKQVGEVVPEDVEPTLVRMFQFLADTQTPNGTWPMVNDSVPGYPVDPRSVLLAGGVLFQTREFLRRGKGGDPGYALWLTGEVPSVGGDVGLNDSRLNDAMTVFKDAGYAVLQDKNQSYLFFDAGPMGPKHIQGHGHADALSFVLYGRGRPLIVDPGVFSYHNKFWRDHFRNTMAHNTITVDNQDQCVFWGPFRIAYPPKVRLLESSDNHVVGEHEGYTRFSKPVIHRRRIERRTTSEWEILDQFEGRGEHEFALNLQFAPGAEAQVSGVNGEARWPDGTSLQVICVTPPEKALAYIEQGWVSPGWNFKDEAPKYVLRWCSKVPVETRVILKIK
jgi:hypothetical protein